MLATGVSFSQSQRVGHLCLAFSCNNLAAVANHILSIGKKAVVCGDFGEHSAAVAEAVAGAVDGELYVPTFEDKSQLVQTLMILPRCTV